MSLTVAASVSFWSMTPPLAQSVQCGEPTRQRSSVDTTAAKLRSFAPLRRCLTTVGCGPRKPRRHRPPRPLRSPARQRAGRRRPPRAMAAGRQRHGTRRAARGRRPARRARPLRRPPRLRLRRRRRRRRRRADSARPRRAGPALGAALGPRRRQPAGRGGRHRPNGVSPAWRYCPARSVAPAAYRNVLRHRCVRQRGDDTR